MSEHRTFRELNGGDKFIGFPVEGDDSGHGGYKSGSCLFCKMRGLGEYGENAMRYDGQLSHFPDDMKVILVVC